MKFSRLFNWIICSKLFLWRKNIRIHDDKHNNNENFATNNNEKSQTIPIGHVDKIVIVDDPDKQNKLLEFIPTTSVDLNRCTKIDNPALCCNLTSCLSACGISTGLATVAGQGLFQATVNPATLIAYGNGTVGSMIVSNGQIVKHAGFVPVSSATIFAPIIVFQLTSMITGQYYLNGISKQLNNICKKLDYMQRFLEADDLGKIQSAYHALNELHQCDNAMPEDFTVLIEQRRSIETVYHKYLLLLQNCGEKHDQYLKLAMGNNFQTKNQINDIEQRINEARINENFEIACTCNFILKLCDLIELELQTKATDISARLGKIDHLKRKIACWKQVPEDMIDVMKEIDHFISSTINCLNAAKKESWLHENDVNLSILKFYFFTNKINENKQKYDANQHKLIDQAKELAKDSPEQIIFDQEHNQLYRVG